MRQRYRLDQVFVQAQTTSDSAGYLRHFQGMRQTRAVIVPLKNNKNLRLIFQFTKMLTMHYTITVTLITCPVFMARLIIIPRARIFTFHRIRSQQLFFIFFNINTFTHIHETITNYRLAFFLLCSRHNIVCRAFSDCEITFVFDTTGIKFASPLQRGTI